MVSVALAHLADRLDVAVSRHAPGRSVAEVIDFLGIGGEMRRRLPGRFLPRPQVLEVLDQLLDLALLDTAEDATSILSAGDVPHMAFKGGALLGRVYAPGCVRMVDLDILVPDRAADRAVRVLLEAGWSTPAGALGPGLDGAPTIPLLRPTSQGRGLDPVAVDLHRLLWSVGRFLPHAGIALPELVWDQAWHDGPIPAPRPGHHAALLVQHLVRHDYLHFRSVFDLVHVWPELMERGEVDAMEDLAGRLGVSRAAGALVDVLARDLELPPLPGMRRDRASWRGGARSVARLLGLTLDATDRDFEAITASRAVRRFAAVDGVRARTTLLRDALLPPAGYLSWRWEDRATWTRWAGHLGRIVARLGLGSPGPDSATRSEGVAG